jgi:hypothetical protein
MKHPSNTRSRAVAESIPAKNLLRDPLWMITVGMGAFFAIVAALLAAG